MPKQHAKILKSLTGGNEKKDSYSFGPNLDKCTSFMSTKDVFSLLMMLSSIWYHYDAL